jgi:adenylosuccinate synthase
MPCTIVVGGQYGGEGKGKVVALRAGRCESPWVVRCGGANSGHTVTVAGREVVLRQVPAGAGHPSAVLLLAAGCAVDEDVLLAELESLQIPKDRIIVDPRGVVVADADRRREEELAGRIGSTASGTGAALARRMTRCRDVRLVGESDRLRRKVRIESVASLVHSHLAGDGCVIVEGTQGFGLSLLHGRGYPFVTARDTTASGFASEVGLAPKHVDSVVMVMRTFPIRVGGNSGPMANEITWEKVRELGGAPEVIDEYTSVTKRLRRVAIFDVELVKEACRYNQPSSLAVMGLDRLDYRNCDVRSPDGLTDQAWRFLEYVERETGVPVSLAGTGFATDQAVFVHSHTGARHV